MAEERELEWAGVLEYPAGMGSDGRVIPAAGVICLCWKSRSAERAYQVYVDGEAAGVSTDPAQRMMLLPYDPRHTALIEIVGVEWNKSAEDYSSRLKEFCGSDGCHAVLTWPCMGTIPAGSAAEIFWDGGSGVMNREEALSRIPIWTSPHDLWGFGMGEFGEEDFGWNGSGACGFGEGGFGAGNFGWDARMVRFTSEPLGLGRYQFEIRISDAGGRIQEEEAERFAIVLDPVPDEPGLKMERYDSESDVLELRIV